MFAAYKYPVEIRREDRKSNFKNSKKNVKNKLKVPTLLKVCGLDH